MSGLLKVDNGQNAMPTFTGLRVQTSAYLLPIPVVYGRARTAANLLQIVDFSSKGGGGKSKSQNKGQSGTTYTGAVVLGICEGPIADIGFVWSNRNTPDDFETVLVPEGWSLFKGTSSQAPWSYMTTHHPTQALPYQFTACVAIAGVSLPSATLQNYNFEVLGLLSAVADTAFADGTCAGGGSSTAFNTDLTQPDQHWQYGTIVFRGGALASQSARVLSYLHASGALVLGPGLSGAPAASDPFFIRPWGDVNPKDILYDILTDLQHGFGSVIPTDEIGDLTSFHDYCAAAGLFMAPVYDSQGKLSSALDNLFKIANSAPVWSDGVLKVIPFGDQALTGHGITWTPNTTPEYDLSDKDFLAPSGQDPIETVRVSPTEAYNQQTVEYENRHDELLDDASGQTSAPRYRPEPVEAKGQAAIDAFGLLRAQPASLHDIKDPVVAQQVATLLLQRLQSVRNTYKFKLPWRFSLLEPMDLVTLTDPGLGLKLTPVRLMTVSDLEDGSGIDCEAEDWPFGIATAAQYSTQGGTGYSPATNVPPGNTLSPVILDAPPALAQTGALEEWVAASGGPNWGGCQVWISTDNSHFTQVGQITQRGNYGVLTAILPTNAAYPATDTTHTLAVDLSNSEGALATVPSSDFNRFLSLCYVGTEFLAFETAALTSAFNYSLTTMYRGLYQTAPASHAIADPFVRCDQTIARIPWPQGQLGDTLYFKFPAFNIYGQAQQSLASVLSVSHVIGQPPNITAPILLMEVTQVSSAGTTAVFTLTVHDPTGQLATCTVTPSFQGISALNNDTLGIPAATWTATIGTAYQFTATLQPTYQGGGYVKFHATQPGWFDGWETWFTASAAQDATPSMVIAIGNNQKLERVYRESQRGHQRAEQHRSYPLAREHLESADAGRGHRRRCDRQRRRPVHYR